MIQELVNSGLTGKESQSYFQDTESKWTHRVGLTNDLLADDGLGGQLIKTSAKGEFTFSGLKIGGRISTVAINNTTWTALPVAPLANRNAIAIQNESGVSIKIGYDPLEPGYVGMTVADGGERQYDIAGSIVLYAKSSSGNVNITVEELA